MISSPYHPASNGLAERSVQMFKEHMMKISDGTLDTRISRFLFGTDFHHIPRQE